MTDLADELRKRKAALETPQLLPSVRDTPPAPKPKKVRKPKVEIDSMKEMADATGIPDAVFLSPHSNQTPNQKMLLSPAELDEILRKKNHVPISATERSLAIYHIPDPDEKAFVMRYSRSRRDFETYYRLAMRENST